MNYAPNDVSNGEWLQLRGFDSESERASYYSKHLGRNRKLRDGKDGADTYGTKWCTFRFRSRLELQTETEALQSRLPLTYTLKCDSSTAVLDGAHLIRFQSGAATVTVPLSTATGCTGNNMAFTLVDDGAGTLTVNRTSADTFSIFDGVTNTDGATSFTLTKRRIRQP